jgi:hypothetical protein
MALAISNTTKKSPFAVTSSGTPSYSASQTNPSFKGNSAFSGLFSIGQQGQVVPKAAAPSTVGPTQRAPVLQTAPIPQTTPIQQQTTQPVRGVLSYPGFVGDLAGASRPSETQQGLVKNLTKTAEGNTKIGEQAAALSKDYGERIAEVGRLGAGAQAGALSTGTDVVGSGNAAIASQSASQRMSALSAAQQAALQGTGQQLTALGQEAGAYGTALGGANTQQQQQITGITSAAGLAQPSPAAVGQTVFNPLTGQYEGGAGGLTPEVMQQYAQMAATGQYSAIPSFITSNPVLNAELNVAAKGINPNYTPVGAAGASDVLQTVPALQSANAAAEGIKNTINTYLAANPQLNPSNLAASNVLQQWIEGKQLTDPKYQTLFNYLDEYTNTLAPILGVGGNPTNFKTQIAQGFVNAAASGQSITQVLNAMSTLATNKINDIQAGALGGHTTVPEAGGTGTGGIFDW